MRISLEEFHSNISKILIFFLVLINLLLTFLPLTKTLGYEFSVINGLILFIIGGLQIIIVQRKDFVIDVLDLLLKNKWFILFSILFPFLIGFLSSVLNSNCPIKGGILFYLVISIPSFFFGGVLGSFCTALSRKYSIYIFIIISFGLIISPLTELFFNPQIYFYNPVFGLFPGTIYDEDLSVDRILIAYRIFNIAFFIGLVSISEYLFGKNKLTKILTCILLITITITFSYLKPTFQFASDSNRLEINLSKSIITDSFNIHFSPSMNHEEVEFVTILHGYYLDQIKIDLKVSSSDKIDSYIFKNRNQKRVILGAGNANIAKPWLNQIYLNSSNYEKALKHELVHVVGGKFGETPLKVAEDFSPSMIEGFAMAIENDYDGYPVHYMAKLAYQAGYKFPIERLFSGFNFFANTSSISYTYAGSFIKYLCDKYGVNKIKILYGDSDFQKIYGKDISTLAVEYNIFLKNYKIEFNKYKAQLYFGGTTIFKKYCPRVAAAEVRRGFELFNMQNTAEALALFQKVFQYSNSYQSLSGILACYSKEKKNVEAKKLLSEQLYNFKMSPNYFNLQLGYGDVLIKCNDRIKALDTYDSLLIQNPHIQYTNEVMIRKSILNEGIDSLKNYFAKDQTQRYQKLLKMNKREINYFSIPSLLRYAECTNLEIKELFVDLKKKIVVTDPISRYAAFEISKLALKKSDYVTAQYFAILTLNYKQDDDLNHQYIENLRMVNWFKNNHDEIKITYSK